MKKALRHFLPKVSVKKCTFAGFTHCTLNVLSTNYSVIMFYEILPLGLRVFVEIYCSDLYLPSLLIPGDPKGCKKKRKTNHTIRTCNTKINPSPALQCLWASVVSDDNIQYWLHIPNDFCQITLCQMNNILWLKHPQYNDSAPRWETNGCLSKSCDKKLLKVSYMQWFFQMVEIFWERVVHNFWSLYSTFVFASTLQIFPLKVSEDFKGCEILFSKSAFYLHTIFCQSLYVFGYSTN